MTTVTVYGLTLSDLAPPTTFWALCTTQVPVEMGRRSDLILSDPMIRFFFLTRTSAHLLLTVYPGSPNRRVQLVG